MNMKNKKFDNRTDDDEVITCCESFLCISSSKLLLAFHLVLFFILVSQYIVFFLQVRFKIPFLYALSVDSTFYGFTETEWKKQYGFIFMEILCFPALILALIMIGLYIDVIYREWKVAEGRVGSERISKLGVNLLEIGNSCFGVFSLVLAFAFIASFSVNTSFRSWYGAWGVALFNCFLIFSILCLSCSIMIILMCFTNTKRSLEHLDLEENVIYPMEEEITISENESMSSETTVDEEREEPTEENPNKTTDFLGEREDSEWKKQVTRFFKSSVSIIVLFSQTIVILFVGYSIVSKLEYIQNCGIILFVWSWITLLVSFCSCCCLSIGTLMGVLSEFRSMTNFTTSRNIRFWLPFITIGLIFLFMYSVQDIYFQIFDILSTFFESSSFTLEMFVTWFFLYFGFVPTLGVSSSIISQCILCCGRGCCEFMMERAISQTSIRQEEEKEEEEEGKEDHHASPLISRLVGSCCCLSVFTYCTVAALIILTLCLLVGFIVISSIMYLFVKHINCPPLQFRNDTYSHLLDDPNFGMDYFNATHFGGVETISDKGRWVSTHNSYHRISIPIFKQWQSNQYDLKRQLEMGVRGFELDIHFSKVTKRWTVFHVVGDVLTHCRCLTECLTVVKDWSDSVGKNHDPFLFMLELKRVPDLMDFCRSYEQDGVIFDHLEEEVLSVFDLKEDIVIPRMIQGRDYESVREAVDDRGWPKIEAMRGKVMFLLSTNWITAPCLEIYDQRERRLFFRGVSYNDISDSASAAFLDVETAVFEPDEDHLEQFFLQTENTNNFITICYKELMKGTGNCLEYEANYVKVDDLDHPEIQEILEKAV